ncbi:CHAP domain-containing protein [Kineococcus sp. R8]|uniref:CHAP domain-containing protein n=1 Tax=Kineococcus siccus TaxID=2696567 RepID=UPI0014121D16|nr:CHAP domain-containing protein [Kineococcus siccus]NAZ83944.1 CHAP domain-containing protein [Kineococcus siccus]
MRTTVRAAVATCVIAASTFAAVGPAQAASRDGRCDAGEFCYYFNSGTTGSLSDFTGSVPDYGATQPECYEFKGAGNGQGKCVKNNAASAWNRTGGPVTVFFNSGYGGTAQVVGAGNRADLKAGLKNENASHRLGSSTGGSTSYPARDDYPYRGQGTGVDPWNFYKGQCTSFVAWAVRSRLGVSFSNSYQGQHWGNAEHWDDAARAAGISVTGTPRAGDVAVRNGGTYGHVAFVTKVNSNGSIEVDEYNYVTSDAYSHRTTTVGTQNNQFSTFIHLK